MRLDDTHNGGADKQPEGTSPGILNMRAQSGVSNTWPADRMRLSHFHT